MLSNLAETLHSSAKWKNKQVAKIWGLYLKKQEFGDTMQSPEGLEDSPFKSYHCYTYIFLYQHTYSIWIYMKSNGEKYWQYLLIFWEKRRMEKICLNLYFFI